MRLRFMLLSIFTICVVAPASSWAGWHEFQHRCQLDWYRNNLWPKPFTTIDHMAVCSPFVAMAQNGWYQQSTLSSFHFDPRTHELTEAGKLKVRHIVVNHPENQRTVFILQAMTDEDSSRRLDSVQRTVAQASNGTSMPEVRLVTLDPPGKPALEIDAISRQLQATIPPPRLPAFKSTSGSN